MTRHLTSPTVPSNWASAPLWSLTRRVSETGFEHLPLLSVYREFGVVLREGREDNYNKASEDLSKYQRVLPGDLVLNKMKTWQGSLGVSAYEGIVSPAYIVCRPYGVGLDGRYLHHLLRSRPYIAEYGARSKGIRPQQWDLPWDQLRQIQILLPPPDEQRRIAEFLDGQVKRIDDAIRLRQEQLKLVAGRSVETAKLATTVGDNAAQTRKTGISWMPLMNAEWTLTKVGRSFMTGSGTTPAASEARYFDGPYQWVNTGDLRDGPVVETRRSVTSRALSDYSSLKLFEPGTLLVAMYGATIGRVGILDISACVNQACCALYNSTDVLTEYAALWFIAHRSEIILLGAGGGQPNISQDLVRDLRIPAPGLKDQAAIIGRLKELRSHDDLFSALVGRQIELLSEQRQAFITAAVTGEFDVSTARGVV